VLAAGIQRKERMKTLIRQWGWIAVVASIVLGVVAFKQRDARIAARGAALALAKQDMARIEALEDSLAYARLAVRMASNVAHNALAGYDSIRKNPAIRRVVLPGETDTVTVVRTEYVTAADSMRQACGVLELTCTRYRMHADSTMAAQARVIGQLQIADRNKVGLRVRPGLFGGYCIGGPWCGGAGVVLTF
jgi:hypothetical protein